MSSPDRRTGRRASRRRCPCRRERTARSDPRGCPSACRSPPRRCRRPGHSRRSCGFRTRRSREAFAAAVSLGSAMATSLASGTLEIARACTWPMRPAPRTAKRIVMCFSPETRHATPFAVAAMGSSEQARSRSGPRLCLMAGSSGRVGVLGLGLGAGDVGDDVLAVGLLLAEVGADPAAPPTRRSGRRGPSPGACCG